MYSVASPDTDPNPRGGGQLPNPRVQFYANECNEGRDALRVQFYANECNEERDALRVQFYANEWS